MKYNRVQVMDYMPVEDMLLLVDASVLPEVFLKVVRAKRLLAQGKAKNLSEATKLAEISRSAFYKYKDSVFAYEDTAARQIATIYAELVDEPGVLSSLLAELSGMGANILTINQNIPVDGVAPVSVSLRTGGLHGNLDALMERISGLDGIVAVKKLSN